MQNCTHRVQCKALKEKTTDEKLASIMKGSKENQNNSNSNEIKGDNTARKK